MRLIPFFIAAIFLPFLCLDIIPCHNSNSHKFNQLLPQLQKFSATSPNYSTNHPPKPKLRRPLHRAEHGKAQRVNNRGLSVAKPPDRMPLLQIRLQRREPQPRQPMERRLSSLRQRFTASALWTEGLPALTSCEARDATYIVVPQVKIVRSTGKRSELITGG